MTDCIASRKRVKQPVSVKVTVSVSNFSARTFAFSLADLAIKYQAVYCSGMISKSEQTLIWVHVSTRAHANSVDGWIEGVLHIRIRAIAEKGKANKAVLELLAGSFLCCKD